MSLISRLTTWTVSQILTSSALNSEFNNITNLINNLDSATTAWTNVRSSTSSLGVATATSIALNGGTVLNTYSQGTWTPSDQSGAALSLTVTTAKYTQIGNVMYIQTFLAYPVTASGLSAKIGGLPVACASYGTAAIYTNLGGINIIARFESGTSNFIIVSPTGGTAATNANLSSGQVILTGFYLTS